MRRVQAGHRAKIEDRRDKVMELARQGHSENEIALAVGVSQPTVNRDIKKRIELCAKNHADSGKVRTLTINRLEALLQKWWEEAGRDSVALKNCLEIIDKIARFSGVAPAQKMEVAHSGQIDGQVQKTLRVEFVDSGCKTVINGDSVEVDEQNDLLVSDEQDSPGKVAWNAMPSVLQEEI